MPTLESNGVELHWQQFGQGSPVILVHGFGESAERMWVETGFAEALVQAGHRPIVFDLRGHGKSDKPREAGAYHIDLLTQDLANVARAAGAPRAHYLGFSMGAELVFRRLLEVPESALGSILIAMGRPVMRPRRKATALSVEALSTDDPSSLHPMLQKLRRIHEGSGNDLPALTSLLRAEIKRVPLTPEQIASFRVPALFISGEKEQVVGDAQVLADLVVGSQVKRIPGADHDATPRALRARELAIEFITATNSKTPLPQEAS
ncbi:alpha/beta hydrolase [Myxococcota bacterium]|nr:alpha/beta hydrolase [Myxococcota bacterium]